MEDCPTKLNFFAINITIHIFYYYFSFWLHTCHMSNICVAHKATQIRVWVSNNKKMHFWPCLWCIVSWDITTGTGCNSDPACANFKYKLKQRHESCPGIWLSIECLKQSSSFWDSISSLPTHLMLNLFCVISYSSSVFSVTPEREDFIKYPQFDLSNKTGK